MRGKNPFAKIETVRNRLRPLYVVVRADAPTSVKRNYGRMALPLLFDIDFWTTDVI